ncbi:MAG: hypothetical protein M1377_02425 [Deltaproteobacteria bacterium]|nr:hypothetical protein [Deltaproteobacteria bacterium]
MIRQVAVVVAVNILWGWGMVWSDEAVADTDACTLLSAGEIESVVGEKVTTTPSHGVAGVRKAPGMSSTCYPIKAGIYSVRVRFGKKAADSGKKEKAGIEMFKKMGIKVTVEKHGNTTCSTVIPSDPRMSGSMLGFNTTCVVEKGGLIVGVEIEAPSEAKMVPVSKVSPLAEKAASRL